MRKTITKAEQQRINELLDARRRKQVKVIRTINGKERLLQYEQDNKIARNGMTYLQIEQLDKHNF